MNQAELDIPARISRLMPRSIISLKRAEELSAREVDRPERPDLPRRRLPAAASTLLLRRPPEELPPSLETVARMSSMKSSSMAIRSRYSPGMRVMTLMSLRTASRMAEASVPQSSGTQMDDRYKSKNRSSCEDGSWDTASLICEDDVMDGTLSCGRSLPVRRQ